MQYSFRRKKLGTLAELCFSVAGVIPLLSLQCFGHEPSGLQQYSGVLLNQVGVGVFLPGNTMLMRNLRIPSLTLLLVTLGFGNCTAIVGLVHRVASASVLAQTNTCRFGHQSTTLEKCGGVGTIDTTSPHFGMSYICHKALTDYWGSVRFKYVTEDRQGSIKGMHGRTTKMELKQLDPILIFGNLTAKQKQI